MLIKSVSPLEDGQIGRRRADSRRRQPIRAPGLRLAARAAQQNRVPGRGHLHDHHRDMCGKRIHVAYLNRPRPHGQPRNPSETPSTPRVRLPDTPPGTRRASIRGGRFLNSHQASRSIRLPAVRSAPLPQHGYTGRPAPIEREVSQAYSSSSSADSAGLMVSRKRLRLASYSSRVTTSSMRRLMPATSSPVMATRRSVTRSLTSSKMAGA